MTARGLVIAAATSGAGKTTVTLGLLAALARRGVAVAGAKSGPDYIDPAFHAVATGRLSVNLDAWAMSATTLRARAAAIDADLLVVEGAVGVLDGAGRGASGSVADLAAHLGLPLVLVVDAARTAGSSVLAPAGLRALRPDLTLAGVILNRIGSPRHLDLATAAFARVGIPVLGHLPRAAALTMPERHLGLVQAAEVAGLAEVIDAAATATAAGIDLDRLIALAQPVATDTDPATGLPPPGQRIAIACDIAFSFTYPHLLDDWRGAEILPFSPLADEAPDPRADAIFLPGGYPELHAGRLASADRFRTGMTAAAARGARIYGECGGFMALGDGLVDAEGTRHAMLGLLPLETTFEHRKLSLGYRKLAPLPGAPWSGPLVGHEFHYAQVTAQGAADRLFTAQDADDHELGAIGLQRGSVCGSFAHVIGRAPERA